MEEYEVSQGGHYFSDEDIISNLKADIRNLYDQGDSDSDIVEKMQRKCSVYSIDAIIELIKYKEIVKKKMLKHSRPVTQSNSGA